MSSLAGGSASASAARSSAALRFVNSTGHSLSGPFLQYLQYMGEGMLGDPLSEPMELDGTTVQWFERGRLDLTPTGGVVLGPVGQILGPTPAAASADADSQSMAKMSTASVAISTWVEEHGGEALFGPALGPASGTSQWFERARIDYNPDQDTVELGAIGGEAMRSVGLDPDSLKIQWVAATTTAALRDAPLLRAPSTPLAAARPLMQVGSAPDWTQVWDPIADKRGWIPANVVGPASAPEWVDTISELTPSTTRGRIVDWGGEWEFNRQVSVVASGTGSDGTEWFVNGGGSLIPGTVLRTPTPPARYYPGKWIDADLNIPVLVTAYEGDKVIYAALGVKGKPGQETRVGNFKILRRVANERMSSASFGRPGLYDITGVLFTQYFTEDGAAIHYNYWRSNWGGSGSFGCLGMTYDDSKFFWDWATIGTPVITHY